MADVSAGARDEVAAEVVLRPRLAGVSRWMRSTTTTEMNRRKPLDAGAGASAAPASFFIRLPTWPARYAALRCVLRSSRHSQRAKSSGRPLWPLSAEARAVTRLRGAVLVESLFVIGRNGSADRPSRWKGKRPAAPALVKVPLFLTRQVRQGLCAAWAIHLEAIANHGKSLSGWRPRSHPANPRFIREVHLSFYRRHWTDKRRSGLFHCAATIAGVSHVAAASGRTAGFAPTQRVATAAPKPV